MPLPVYTELSNFSTRVNGKKITTDISVVLIVNSYSDPVDTINSIYQFADKTRYKAEFILVNTDKEGFQYERIMQSFPAMRVILPQDKIGLNDAISLAVEESLSRNILFIGEEFVIESLPLEVLEMYFSESSFGILTPLIIQQNGDTVPGIVKGNIRSGFLDTLSVDIVGTAVSTIYPKYFCFILNREAFLTRNIELSQYSDSRFTLLELGWNFWKEGYILTQVRGFKVTYRGNIIPDITRRDLSADAVFFTGANIKDPVSTQGRRMKIVLLILEWIFTLRWKRAAEVWTAIRKAGAQAKKNISHPVEDSAIFTIINRDLE